MSLSETQSRLISALIQHYATGNLAGSNVTLQEIRDIAVHVNVLPLALSFDGMLAISPDGDIFSISYDDPIDVQKIDDTRIINLALCQGAKTYSELAWLMPMRPSDAQICPYCHGTGIESLSTKHNLPNIVCYCGGLGWLPN